MPTAWAFKNFVEQVPYRLYICWLTGSPDTGNPFVNKKTYCPNNRHNKIMWSSQPFWCTLRLSFIALCLQYLPFPPQNYITSFTCPRKLSMLSQYVTNNLDFWPDNSIISHIYHSKHTGCCKKTELLVTVTKKRQRKKTEGTNQSRLTCQTAIKNSWWWLWIKCH